MVGGVNGIPYPLQIEIGVVTQAADAEMASRENATRLAAVLKSLRQTLPAEARIQTTQLSVQPNYQHEEGKAPRITAYTVSNQVRVETTALQTVGQAIDGAMKAGANTIQSLQFRVKNERDLRAQALRNAVADARAQAETIAAATDVRILRVLSVQAERSGPPVIYGQRYAVMEKVVAVDTPVEQGTIDLETRLTLTVEVGPK